MNKVFTALLWIIRIVFPCAVVYGSIALFKHMMASAPQQQRKPPEERSVIAEVSRVKRQSKAVFVNATGTVVPVERVSLKARVSGEAVELNPRFEPGEIIRRGEVIVSIDRADYLLALRTAESALVQAEYSYKVELGYQQVARHEWELLDDKEHASELEKELTLRKPHLEKVKAGVESAMAALEQAKLNLERTSLTLPFDALVLSRSVSAGTQVNTQTELGVFVDASLFRVEAALPFDRLEWIAFPSDGRPGAPVEVRATGGLNGGAVWKGVVSRLIPAIETDGRMAQILIDVENPMQGDVPLLLNSFVSVAIRSRELQDVFVIPAVAVHNGDIVYTVNGDSRLVFRKIVPLWRDEEWVLAREGISEDDPLVVSEVPAAVPNMKVVEHEAGNGSHEAAGRALETE